MSEIPKAYEPKLVEEKWYQFWLDNQCFAADPARVTESRPAYSIVIPPPNVTGVLTMGHVLNNTIQDILARKARMDGKEVLWLPGTDHAGIATQNAVEKALKKAGEIKHRDDLGREALVARIWDWKEKYGGIILKQLRALGASCDWSRTRFTMDPEYSRCVMKVFVDLYKKGLIYRGKRMVNWCPASLTALSDEEVIMKEQKGFMYHFRVEVVGATPARSSGHESAQTSPTDDQSRLTSAATSGDGEKKTYGPMTDTEGRVWLTIATTRPETIPADTAVAVNPKDPRYQHLIGKHVVKALPLDVPKEQRLIPIIADEHVDFAFGTGVLKVTPAHDKADYEIIGRELRRWNAKYPVQILMSNASEAEKQAFEAYTRQISEQYHLMEIPEAIDERGVMTSVTGTALAGLDRFKARKVASQILAEVGVLEKEEPYTNNVGFSERADVPIEPRLSEQWFLKYPSVEASKKCVATGEMKFFPDRWAKVYDHWMGGIQDWCISRQLWWGHRIPVWSGFLKLENCFGVVSDSELSKLKDWMAIKPSDDHPGVEVSLSGVAENTTFIRFPNEKSHWDRNKGILVCAATVSEQEIAKLNMLGFSQDPDVLDTWFSSWLWPFATMGWTGDKETDAKNPTLKTFYPTTDLVTGPDIIFFWVARMIMAGHEYMGELPFRNVYFTGIIRDKQGRKMSKSLGNSPDPLDLITQYGADALRFGVMRAAPLGQDVLFDEQSVELGRNFCNKLWNACRFRQMVGSPEIPVEGEISPALLTSDDKWILLKLDQAIREVTQAFADYKFSDATAALYRFFWSEYCDWYVESAKATFQSGSSRRESAPSVSPSAESESGLTSAATSPQAANKLAVIDFVLGHTLRLFHPFLPFITEELWHGMGYSSDLPDEQGGKTIMTANWPKPFDADFRDFYALDDCYLESVDQKHELVTQGRNLRREGNIPSSKKVKFIFKPESEWTPHQIEVLKILLNAESVEQNLNYEPKKGTPRVISPLGELYLPLEGLIDVEAEKVRLTKEKEKITGEIAKVNEKLANPNFTQKVPPAVLEEHRKRLLDWENKLQLVQQALDALNG